MIDKNYLDKLKEDDYIAWDDLINDPMVVGQDTGSGFMLVVVVLMVIIGFILIVLL
jgi:hypothetical protein